MFSRIQKWLSGLLLLVITGPMAWAQQPVEVALAGFAYAGAADTMEARFPWSQRYEAMQKASGTPIGAGLFRALTATQPEHLRIIAQIDELKGRDQAVAVALVIGSETVSHEQFGDHLHKLMVLIRGQTMFFDFKSMNVVRAYPISFAYVDVLDHAPTPDEIMARVKLVYEGTVDKPGVLARFVNNVSQADIPAQVPRFLQVADVSIQPEAMSVLPASIASDTNAANTWLADLVGEAISTRTGVPIVPYTKGYAIGNVMAMRVSDGTVYALQLPKPDYEINVALNGFRKVKFSEIVGGATSLVYGAYASLGIVEPLGNKSYLNTELKNGETRVIPASQQAVDDFAHYYDAVNGLFVKLAQVLDGKGDGKWLKSAAAAKDIDQQIANIRELIQLCK